LLCRTSVAQWAVTVDHAIKDDQQTKRLCMIILCYRIGGAIGGAGVLGVLVTLVIHLLAHR
jgi:hypothetical protein